MILGTVAVKDPDLVRQACRVFFPAASSSASMPASGRVAVEGWAEVSEITADLARRFEDAGAAAIVYTDIDRDGALEGAQRLRHPGELAAAISTPVIASGGVAPRSTTSPLCWQVAAAASKASSPAARSTTGASIRRRRSPSLAGHAGTGDGVGPC